MNCNKNCIKFALLCHLVLNPFSSFHLFVRVKQGFVKCYNPHLSSKLACFSGSYMFYLII